MTTTRSSLGVACCIAGTLLAAISANAGDQQAAETTITYQWGNGTVAPQYHQDHRITIRSSGASEISVIKGVGGKELKAAFDPERVKLKELMDYIHSNGLDVPPPLNSIEPPRPRPGDGTCNLHFVVRDTAYAMSCRGQGVGLLLDMMKALVPASLLEGEKSASTPTLVPPISFGGGVPDVASASITLNKDLTYELSISYESITRGGSASRQKGRWWFDPASSIVTLRPEDPGVKAGSLTIVFSSPVTASLDAPHLQLTAIPPKEPRPPSVSPDAGTREISIKTINNHFLSAADGGGYGGPDAGPDAVALHSDAARAGEWEHFDWIWQDSQHTKFALRTAKGLFVTAVNGGGLGGPNDGRSPFHTDATNAGADEIFVVSFAKDGKVTLRTRKGFYVTAVNGGGSGGPDTSPIHTDATAIGAWETFRLEEHTHREP